MTETNNVKTDSQVEIQMRELEISIRELSSTITELALKLLPVLRDEPPSECIPSSVPQLVPLAHALREAVSNVRYLSDGAHSMLQRIEL